MYMERAARIRRLFEYEYETSLLVTMRQTVQ